MARIIAAGESLALCCARAEPFLSPKLAAYYRTLLTEWDASVRGYNGHATEVKSSQEQPS